MSPPRASGYFRTSYREDLRLLDTRTQRASFMVFCLLLLGFPFLAGGFGLDLANQVLLATVGAVALMLLTGFAGQVSLGHAGLLAAGAFTTGVLVKELSAPFWLTLPASAATGALLGIVFGLPSLRLRGLYLAVSTLALHFTVIYLGHEYETRRGFSTGVVIEPPALPQWLGGWTLTDSRAWYFVLLAAAAGAVLLSLNLLRSRTGRAWRAIHGKETVAAALGIDVRIQKLLAFVISSTMTAVAGCLFAYYRGFVSAEAFSLFLTIQYVAMVIIGGLGSILGAVLGALFVTLFPYLVEWLVSVAPVPAALANSVFALNYAAFGLVMILFLVFEPMGLVGVWRRLQNYFLLWPFKQTPVGK
jgi:branched-chain amino acid transport system permease protein